MSSLPLYNRVYRLEIQSVMLVFSTPLVNLRPSNLLTGVHVFMQYSELRGGGGIWGLRQISTYHQVHLLVNFLRKADI